MTHASASPHVQSVQAIVAEHRTWFMVLGIVLAILGVVAIAFPFVTTIAAKIFLGWLFLIGGFAQIAHAFSTQRWSEFFLDLLIGVLYVAAGGWLAFFPLTGIITLTIFLAALFIVEGIVEIVMAFRLNPRTGWVWMLISGIVAVAAGVLIFAGLPSTATWAIGLLVGINLLMSGFSYLLLASAVRA
ncbi:MAG: HdeD family acid-resistance protein [Bradyrhizobiaceae bacterium]|nr:HdeD family acid-resistance protein [Bradyrhizobiaceae bacterium]